MFGVAAALVLWGFWVEGFLRGWWSSMGGGGGDGSGGRVGI